MFFFDVIFSENKEEVKLNVNQRKELTLNDRLKEVIIDYQPFEPIQQQINENQLTKYTSIQNETAYAKYQQLKQDKLQAQEIDINNNSLQMVTVTGRQIDGNKIILTCLNPKKEYEMKETEERMTTHLTLNTSIIPEFHQLEVSTNYFDIKCTSRYAMNMFYHDFNRLSKVNGYNIKEMSTDEAILLLKYESLPFNVSFNATKIGVRMKLKKCCGCSRENKCIEILIKWFTKFMKLSMGVVSKASSMLDAITDIILLYKAQKAGAIAFTMVLFITLLAPYILSYSSGVQIFLYRKTFQNVQIFTFKSLLLGLYLFPTGIFYFILLDIIDALMETYKWFAHGLINKIQTKQALVQIESNCAEYFGMSRMDWFSFKKQKLIAQLLLSVPFAQKCSIILFTFHHFVFCLTIKSMVCFVVW